MSIQTSIISEFQRYGENLTVITEKGRTSFKGFLQPLLYKNKLYLGGSQLPDGFFDNGYYMLICSLDVKLPVLGTCFFEDKENKYVLKRSETVKVNSKPMYTWAVLMPYGAPSEEDFYET